MTNDQIVGNYITKYKNQHHCPTNTSQDINNWEIKFVHEIDSVGFQCYLKSKLAMN